MEKIETAITKMLGIRFPIISAPMFLVSNPDMIVAVGEAGALGAMPALNALTSDIFRHQLREIKSRTDKPFAINFMLLLNPRLKEDWAIILEEKVPLVITSLGNPTEFIKQAHDSNIKVFCDVVNLKHAEKATKAGADALIAVAAGAGGHAGPIVPTVLIPWLKQHLDIPIIGAGGLATGQGLASILALGADGGYFGTRFVASEENKFNSEFKQMILEATPEDILNTAEVSGHPANFLKKSIERFRTLGEKSDKWVDAWSAGQTVGLVDDIKPCAKIIEDIVREYREAVAALPR